MKPTYYVEGKTDKCFLEYFLKNILKKTEEKFIIKELNGKGNIKLLSLK